jgi:hypothetical protein
MKTKFLSILFIAVTSLSVFTISCKKEDTANSKASILGKWNVMSESYISYDSLQNVTFGDTDYYAIGEFVLDFRDNGMVINIDEKQYKDTWFYTLSGVKLTISHLADMSDPDEFTVQNLTQTDLNFSGLYLEDNGAYEKFSFSAKR